jgi:hypothetical protein
MTKSTRSGRVGKTWRAYVRVAGVAAGLAPKNSGGSRAERRKEVVFGGRNTYTYTRCIGVGVVWIGTWGGFDMGNYCS